MAAKGGSMFLSLLLLFAVSDRPSAVPHSKTSRPVTIDDTLNLRSAHAPQLSPDASQLIFGVAGWEWPGNKVAPNVGTQVPEMRSHIWLVPTSGKEPARQITFGERGESRAGWSPDGRFISFVASRSGGAAAPDPEGGPRPQIWLMPAAGGEPFVLTAAREGIGAFRWSPDGTRIAYVMRDPYPKEEDDARRRRDDERVFEADQPAQHLWVIDVASKKATQVTSGASFSVADLSWSPDGTRLAFGTRKSLGRDGRSDVMVVTVSTKAVQPIAQTPAVEGSPAWSPDGKTIAYTMTPVGDVHTNPDGISTHPLRYAHLMLYDVGTGMAKDMADPKFDYSVGGLSWTPDSRRILFIAGDRVYLSVFAYDIGAKRYLPLTPGRMVYLSSISRDGTMVAFTMDSPTAPSDVYVAPADFSAPRKLTTTNPEADDFALGTTEVITWKSDGEEIQGVLIKPVGYQPGKRYPLLVDIHGGPSGSHFNGYKLDPHSPGQVWAGQGWAVLYPNPRGSSTYGEKFLRQNIADWGGGDYRDIMAGADEVIRAGIADPDKLGVLGWSYGGYMTSWIVSQTGRFKGARMGAGASNLQSMYGTTDFPGYVGAYFNNYPNQQTLPLLLARSSLTHVDKVATPLLILHGMNDERVPIGQPMEFYRALKDRGKTVELVLYPREGHSFGEYYHQRDRMRRDLEWMTKYVLAGVPASRSTPY